MIKERHRVDFVDSFATAMSVASIVDDIGLAVPSEDVQIAAYCKGREQGVCYHTRRGGEHLYITVAGWRKDASKVRLCVGRRIDVQGNVTEEESRELDVVVDDLHDAATLVVATIEEWHGHILL